MVNPTGDAAVETDDEHQPEQPGADIDNLQQGIVEEVIAEREAFFAVEKDEDIDTTVTTIGAEVDMARLGVEVGAEQVKSFDYRVDQLATIEDKTIADIEKGTPQERLILEVALQGMTHRLIGSVWSHYMFTLPQQRGRDWKKDGFAIEDTKRKVAQRVLQVSELSPTYLDTSEQKLLTFINGSSTLAAGLRVKYPTLLKEEEENMVGLMEHHTYEFLKLPKEEQAEEIGLVGGALQTAKDELGSLTDPAITGKEKAKIVGKYALIAGAGAFVLWRVFKERKVGADGKKEGMSFRKKLLITLGLGGLAYVVLDQLDKKKKQDAPNNKVEDDIDDKDDNVEAIDFANTVPIEEQSRAATAADAMNGLFMASPDALGGAGYEQLPGGDQVKGLLFGVMQAEYGSVGAATKPYAYFYEYGETSVQKFRDKVKTMPLQWVKTLGNSMLAGITGNPIKKFAAEKTTEGMVSFLENYAKDTDFLQQLFRKQTSIISYLHYKKKHLEQKLAEEHLRRKHGEEKWEAFGATKKADLIEDMLDDPALYEKYIAKAMTDFNNSPIINLGNNGTSALAILESHGILDGSVGPLEKEFFEQTEKDMNDLVEYDPEEGTSLLTGTDYFETDATASAGVDGAPPQKVLTEVGQESTSKLIENITEHYEGIGRVGFFRSYLPLLNLLEHDSETEEQLMNMYDGMMAPLVEQLGEWQGKVDACTLTPADFEEMKQTTAYYTAYFKQMAVSQYAITEMKETEGGGYVLLENALSFGGQMGENIVDGASKIGGGALKIVIGGEEDRARVKAALEVGDGVLELAGVAASAAPLLLTAELVTYPLRFPLARWKFKLAPRTPTLWKRGVRSVKWGVRKSGLAAGKGMRRIFSPRYMYRGRFNLLKYDLAAGRISFERAADIAKHHKFTITTGTGQKIINSGDEMVRTLLGGNITQKPKLVAVVKKYRHLANIRKQILDQDNLGKWRKMGSRSNPNNQLYGLKSMDTVKQLKKIDAVLSAVTDPTEQKILQRVLSGSKDLTKVDALTSRWSTLRMKLSITPDGTLVSSADEFLRAWKMKPKTFAKRLTSIDDLDELPKMMQFIQKAGKMGGIQPGSEARFLRNVAKQWSTLKDIDTPTHTILANLNKLKVARAIEYIQDNIKMGPKLKKLQDVARNTSAFLKKQLSNPRFPRNTSANVEVNKYASFFDDVAGEPHVFARAMNGLGAKIKGAIPEVSVAKVTAMQNFMKANPKLMKGIGGLSVAVLGGVNVYFTLQEAGSYTGINQDKVDMYQQKAFNEGLLTAGGLALVFIPGVGWVAGLILAAVEGLVWIANDMYFNVMDAYKKNFNERKEKGVEAKQEAMQHVMSIMAGEHELERSGSEKFTRFFSSQTDGVFSEDADNTTRDALRAWVLYDEIEKDPTGVTLATMIGGINFNQLEENKEVTSEDAGHIFAATRELKERVAKRVSYIEQKIGFTTLAIERKKTRTVWHGNSAGDEVYYVDDTIEVLALADHAKKHGKEGHLNGFFMELLHESQFATYASEKEKFSPDRVDALRQATAEKVAAQPELQKKLLALWYTDRQYLLHLARGSISLMGMIEMGMTDLTDEETTLAQEHMTYLQDFLSRVSFETARDAQYALQGVQHANFDEGLIKTFLLTLDYDQALPTGVDTAEVAGIEAKDDVWMREYMQRSPSVLHNILYDIATEVYGMKIENSPEALERVFTEARGEQHGIYLYNNGTRLGISDSDRSDMTTGMSLDEQLQAIKNMRSFIQGQIDDDDLIDTQTGSGEKLINIEVGGKILAIFNRYFNRLWVNEHNTVTPNYTSILFALDQCACDADGKWVQLSAHDISTGMMLGLKDIGAYVFRQNEQGDYEALRDGKVISVAELYPELGLPAATKRRIDRV